MSGREEPVTRGWRADAIARPLLAWSDRQLAAVGGALETVFHAWRSDWGLAPPSSGAVACEPAEPGNAAHAWQCLGGTGEGAAWTSPTGNEASQLASALFGDTPQVTPLLAEIGGACWSNALERLRAALRLDAVASAPAAPPARALTPWSGHVVANLPWDARLLLEAPLVRALVDAAGAAREPRAPLAAARVPLERALAAAELKLQVQLEGCELAVGSLQDLQLGDVVRLRHRVDAPATVILSGGAALFSGFLARSRGRKAVELAPAIT